MSHIGLFLPTLLGGGAERAFVDLANEFVARGYRVDCVLATRVGPFLAELDPRVRIVDLQMRGWPGLVLRLRAYLTRERPDVLLSGLDPANIVAVIASTLAGMRSRCVISQRAVIRSVYQIELPRTWRVWLALMRLTYPRARLVICNSGAAAEEVTSDLGVDAAKCVVILNPVDMERIEELAAEPVEHPWLAESAPPLLLSVGSLSVRKDMGTLLQALAIVRQTHECNLLILGEGPERAALEAQVRALGLERQVQMPGFAGNPFPFIARADMLVSASLAEGCPNAIQQALACRTPVVATDCPGATADVLEHGRWGRLVPTKDPQAMAEAIVRTIEDRDMPNGRLRARDFDWPATVDRYLNLLLPDPPMMRTGPARPAASSTI